MYLFSQTLSYILILPKLFYLQTSVKSRRSYIGCQASCIIFISTSFVDKIFISNMPNWGHLFISPIFPTKIFISKKLQPPPPYFNGGPLSCLMGQELLHYYSLSLFPRVVFLMQVWISRLGNWKESLKYSFQSFQDARPTDRYYSEKIVEKFEELICTKHNIRKEILKIIQTNIESQCFYNPFLYSQLGAEYLPVSGWQGNHIMSKVQHLLELPSGGS